MVTEQFFEGKEDMHMQALRAATLASTMLATAIVHAQAASRFDLPSQSLGDSLRAVSMQTNTNLFFDPALVAGKQAKALQVRSTIDEALARLLNGTGIKYEFLDEKTIVLSAEKSKDDDVASGTELDAVSGAGINGFWNHFLLAQSNSSSSSTYASNAEVNAGQAAKEDRRENEMLEEIVVTAQRREENLQDVPISVTVLGGKELDESSFSGVTDALNNTPGFVSTPQTVNGGTVFSLRGVSTGGSGLATGASPVGYYINGVPFGFVRNAFLPADPNIYDLERIEVLNGPQGTLYGANSLSGVIRIITRDANTSQFEFKARSSISGTDGGDESTSGDFALNIPLLEDRVAVRFVAGYRDDGGWVDSTNHYQGANGLTPPALPGGYGNNVNDVVTKSYRLQVRLEPSDATTIDFSAWQSDRDASAMPTSDAYNRTSYPADQPGNEEFTAYGLNIAHDFASFSLSSMTSYVDYQSHMEPLSYPGGGDLRLISNFDSAIFAQEFNLNSTTDGPWRWSTGLFYRQAEDPKDQVLDFLNGTLLQNDDFTDSSESYAIYGEIGRSFFNDTFAIQAGLRYFHDEQTLRVNSVVFAAPSVPVGVDFTTTSEALTPRLTLTWQPTTEQSFYASYSQGFRSGYYQQPRGIQNAPSFEPVDPDTLINYEIGAKGSFFSGRLSYEASVFYQDWQDIQRTLGVLLTGTGTGTGTSVGLNGEGASGPGASLSLTVRPLDGLSVGTNLSWNELEADAPIRTGSFVLYDTGDQLALSPGYTASIFASYDWDLWGGYGARVSANANHVPEMPMDPFVSGTAPSQFVVHPFMEATTFVNARLSIDAPEHWTSTLFIDNLTNENADQFQGPILAPPRGLEGHGARPRPRTFGIQFEYKY